MARGASRGPFCMCYSPLTENSPVEKADVVFFLCRLNRFAAHAEMVEFVNRNLSKHRTVLTSYLIKDCLFFLFKGTVSRDFWPRVSSPKNSFRSQIQNRLSFLCSNCTKFGEIWVWEIGMTCLLGRGELASSAVGIVVVVVGDSPVRNCLTPATTKAVVTDNDHWEYEGNWTSPCTHEQWK